MDDQGIDPEEVVNGAWRSVDGRFYPLPSRRPESDPDDWRTKNLEQLLARASKGDPTLALQAVAALRRRVDRLEREAVALARSVDWSWRDIGSLLGLSRSGAQRRYRPPSATR